MLVALIDPSPKQYGDTEMVNPTIPLKRCSRKDECLHPDGSWLPATTDYFMAHKGGLYSQCHYCRKEAKRQSHERNREHNNERTQRWLDEHPDYYRDKHRRLTETDPEYVEQNRTRAKKWADDNPERNRKRVRQWYWGDPERARANRRASSKRHPETAAVHRRLRRMRKRTAEGKYTADDLRLQYRSQNGLCWWCGEKVGDDYHADHLVPLVKGGMNNPENIVISCPKCNLSKGGKLPHEWNGRLF